LKSTETRSFCERENIRTVDFSNFGSLKSTETVYLRGRGSLSPKFQQFRLVEEH